jgi:acyl carrier protein
MTDEITDSGAQVRAWMVAYLADLLDIPQDQVDVAQPFEQYGLDSAATVAFTSDLSNWLGTKLDSRLMVECDSVEAVVRRIGAVHGHAVPA